jgi:hypothetical protein
MTRATHKSAGEMPHARVRAWFREVVAVLLHLAARLRVTPVGAYASGGIRIAQESGIMDFEPQLLPPGDARDLPVLASSIIPPAASAASAAFAVPVAHADPWRQLLATIRRSKWLVIA